MLVSIALLALGVLSQCSQRKEWRQLSAGERKAYLEAVQTLKTRPTGTSDPATWNQDQFADIHIKYYPANHGQVGFFPWHRLFIQGYENALRSINPSISLPYWDWTIDSQNPAGSDLWSNNSFGGTGNPTNNNCVDTGVAAGWMDSTGACIKRCSAWSTLYSSEGVAALLNRATDFKSLQDGIENGPHGLVHNLLGGSCGTFSFQTSANEPIFYLHHAMVDKLWGKWQSCSTFQSLFSASLTTPLPPFNAAVQDTFVTSAGSLCYTYSTSVVDKPVSLQCPGKINGTTATTSGGSSATQSSTSPTPTIVDRSLDFWLQNSILDLLPMKHSLVGAAKVKRDLEPVIANQTDFPLNYAYYPPHRNDFTDLYNLRHPTPISTEFLQRMNMDPVVVREVENYVCGVVDQFNRDPTYQSPVALKFFNTYNKLGRWISS